MSTNFKIDNLGFGEFHSDIWLFSNRSGSLRVQGIFSQGMLDLINSLGFFKKFLDKQYQESVFIREKNNVIEEVSIETIQDSVYTYINQLPNEYNFKYHGMKVNYSTSRLREMFFKESKKIFTNKFLNFMKVHEKQFLKDTKKDSYLFFLNKIVHVDAENISYKNYCDLINSCVWRSDIIARNFNFCEDFENGQFTKFIHNVADKDKITFLSFVSAIGYLLHGFIEAGGAKFVLATDKYRTEAGYAEGGTGKGLYFQGIKHVRPNIVKLDGKAFNPKYQFKFQNVNPGCRLVFLDDLDKRLNLEIFNSCLTDGWNIEKKNKESFFIEMANSPKIYITSNFIPPLFGSTLVRRKVILEFSNFYSKHIRLGNEKPIVIEHGGMFFTSWDQKEWDLFYSFMISCIQYYLQKGLIFATSENFIYNQLLDSTNKSFSKWICNYPFKFNTRYNKKTLYETYINDTSDKVYQRVFTTWVKKFIDLNDWIYSDPESNGQGYIIILEKSVQVVKE